MVTSNLIYVHELPPPIFQRQHRQQPSGMPSFMLINAKSSTQRIDELEILLNTHNIDIAAITETWSPPQVSSSTFDICNFTLLSNPRRNKRGDGVAFYIRNVIQIQTIVEIAIPDELEIIWAWVRPRRLPRTVA